METLTLYRSGPIVPQDQMDANYLAEAQRFDRRAKSLGVDTEGVRRQDAVYFVANSGAAARWADHRGEMGADTEIATVEVQHRAKAYLVEHYDRYARAAAEMEFSSGDAKKKLAERRDSAIRDYFATAIPFDATLDDRWEVLVPYDALR